MGYQSKTTMITMAVGNWSETTECSLSSRFSALHAVAVKIASCCQMDIMSFTPYSLEEAGEECRATVVYVNNGRSLADIRSMTNPEINNKPQSYWMIQDLYEWQDVLDCIVSVKGTDEEWN